MKKNIKIYLYIFVVISFIIVLWSKLDFDLKSKNKDEKVNEISLFDDFIKEARIKEYSFNCNVKKDEIKYLDTNYILTKAGELYEFSLNHLFEDNTNCRKIETDIELKNFYDNSSMVYDGEYNFYDIDKSLEKISSSNIKYYQEDIKDLEELTKDYPYLYFYDVEANSLNLDITFESNKILVDKDGNILTYTNYGYPNAKKLLQSADTELVYGGNSYEGSILTIYRSEKNERLDASKIKYLSSSEEVPGELFGLRVITTSGIYNEAMEDSNCKKDFCNVILEQDSEFSSYFSDIIYSNGKYILLKGKSNKIYDISNYITHKKD